MTAWYNENDHYAADWLDNLIAEKLIAPGVVDRRNIRDVRADDLASFTQCHFFAGLGGWSRSLRIAGFPDTRPVWTGSCPCQPFSQAGQLERFADERHLWPTWVRLIQERRPPIVFGEQVASATEWLRLVRGDLEALDYAVGCAPIKAASAGADHLRDRFWFVADADFAGSQGRPLSAKGAGERAAGPDGVADAAGKRRDGCENPTGTTGRDVVESDSRDVGFANGSGRDARQQATAPTGHGRSAIATGGDFEWAIGADGKARRVKPGVRLLAHGIPARVAKLRALGNAIDPRPAAEFIRAAT